jgi:2-polyprenyl-3-methyl-5-hydroxy-6-metoxy-1,4-benzoquinol methylase
MEKLIVVIMGQNCEKFIGMALESVKDVDEIVFCEGLEPNQKDIPISNSYKIFREKCPSGHWIGNVYNQEDPTMNGKQRNFYLNYIRKEFKNDWCLVIDADEVVENLNEVKKFIQTANPGLYSIHMRHFIHNLGYEDAMVPKHFALNRLFKIDEADKYPEVEHPVLQPKDVSKQDVTEITTLWHLGYISGVFDIYKKYLNHSLKSNMHTPQFLKQWKNSHILGKYPIKEVNILEIPKVILNNFGIDKDEIYFSNRGLEVKHFIMAKQWADFFGDMEHNHNLSVLEFGCGKGPFGYALNSYGINFYGIELSKYAVDNSFIQISKGNLLDYKVNDFKPDIVLLFDVLEHLNYEDLDRAIIISIILTKKYILVSVPVIGDPNLEADSTHIIKESKMWWINKFVEKGLKKIPTPEHFLFKDQILIFEK